MYLPPPILCHERVWGRSARRRCWRGPCTRPWRRGRRGRNGPRSSRRPEHRTRLRRGSRRCRRRGSRSVPPRNRRGLIGEKRITHSFFWVSRLPYACPSHVCSRKRTHSRSLSYDIEPSARASPARTISSSVHSSLMPLTSKNVSITYMPIRLLPSRKEWLLTCYTLLTSRQVGHNIFAL